MERRAAFAADEEEWRLQLSLLKRQAGVASH
jgi:hypothetical protein